MKYYSDFQLQWFFSSVTPVNILMFTNILMIKILDFGEMFIEVKILVKVIKMMYEKWRLVSVRTFILELQNPVSGSQISYYECTWNNIYYFWNQGKSRNPIGVNHGNYP